MSDAPDDLGIPMKPARPAGQAANVAPLGRGPTAVPPRTPDPETPTDPTAKTPESDVEKPPEHRHPDRRPFPFEP